MEITWKKTLGKPRKRWIDSVEEVLNEIRVDTYRELVHDRDRGRKVVLVEKTFREL